MKICMILLLMSSLSAELFKIKPVPKAFENMLSYSINGSPKGKPYMMFNNNDMTVTYLNKTQFDYYRKSIKGKHHCCEISKVIIIYKDKRKIAKK